MITTNKATIVQLLIKDMRYHQLVHGIGQLGFQNELNGSGIMSIVATLMQLTDISTEWEQVYMHTLNLVLHYKISGDGADLKPLAEHAYQQLRLCNGAMG